MSPGTISFLFGELHAVACRLFPFHCNWCSVECWRSTLFLRDIGAWWKLIRIFWTPGRVRLTGLGQYYAQFVQPDYVTHLHGDVFSFLLGKSQKYDANISYIQYTCCEVFRWHPATENYCHWNGVFLHYISRQKASFWLDLWIMPAIVMYWCIHSWTI